MSGLTHCTYADMFAFLTTNTRILKRKKKNKAKNTTVLFFTTDLPPKLEKAAGNRTPSIQPGYNPLPAGCSCSCPTTPVTPALPFPPRLSQLTVHSRGAARTGLPTGVSPLPGPRLGGGSAEKRPRPALPTRNSLSREPPEPDSPIARPSGARGHPELQAPATKWKEEEKDNITPALS